MENSSIIWFIAGIFLLIAELIMPGFVIFFFGIGALITSLLIYMFDLNSIFIQMIIFMVVSILCLVLLRRIFTKLFQGKVSGDKVLKDDFIGRKAIVINEIKPNSLKGKVEINGTNWEADSEFYIEKETVVEITGRKDLTLIVKPID
ncbi:MAG TPA: NfeD family protein [Ignavibacteria bacterium]|nr:NfeD family protein [Ignavibacteria bacterium]HMR42152.1 NfeD family protein [Ignavibacteria bacterium]